MGDISIGNLFGLFGDDEEDTGGYQTSILSDLDIDGDGSIGSKPTSSYDSDKLYDFGSMQVAGSDISPSMQNQDNDSTGNFLTDRRFLGPLLQTGLGLAGAAFGRNSQEKAQKQAAEDKKQQMLMELELEKLKYKYGLKGGSGGGGGGGGGSQRGQQLLNAYQNYIQGVNSVNQNQQGAIRNLGNSITSGYAMGRR
jgi:hypothetical protein